MYNFSFEYFDDLFNTHVTGPATLLVTSNQFVYIHSVSPLLSIFFYKFDNQLMTQNSKIIYLKCICVKNKMHKQYISNNLGYVQ